VKVDQLTSTSEPPRADELVPTPRRAGAGTPTGAEPLAAWNSARSRFAISGAAVLSLLLLAVGFAASIEALRLIGIFGVLVAGVGAAPFQLVDGLTSSSRIAIAVVLGTALATLVGSIMVFVPVWHPVLAAAIVGVGAAGAHAVGARRALAELRRSGRPATVGLGLREWSRSAYASAACSLLGITLSLGAALALGHIEPPIAGFLTLISPAWYVGLLALLAAIVLARGESEPHIVVPVILLIAALTLTPALVYGTPESQSAVKHVVLVEHILHSHFLPFDHAIYYSYSGFFSAIAWLCRLAGVTAPLGLATFWPTLIVLAGAAELRFLFGRVIRSPQRCWIGITMAVLVNAVGQDYFSPQSVGIVLAIGVSGLVITGRHPLVLPRGARIALLLTLGFSLAVTHELSPYLCGGVLIVLAMFRLVNPRWAALPVIAPAAIWAAVNSHALSGFLTFAAIGNLSNFKPPAHAAVPGLSRLAIVGESTDALVTGLLILIAMAGVGFARNRRRAGAWAFGISAGVGIVFIAINPYGDEGIFRASLFGIPWLVLLALAAVRKHPWRWGAFGVLSVVLLGTYLVAQFGLDQTNVVRRSDVGALEAFIANAPPGSYRLEFAAEGDIPSTVDPALHNLIWDPLWNPHSRDQVAVHSTRRPTQSNLAQLTTKYVQYAETISGTPARNLFAVYSPTSAAYSVVYGLETTANSVQWRNLFLASPQWRVIYASHGSYLFRYVPPRPASTPRPA